MSQGLCQGCENKKDLLLSLEDFMFFHSRVITPFDFELLTGKNSVILNSVSLLPTIGLKTH